MNLDPEAVRAARANPCAWAKLVSGGQWLPAKHLRYLAKQLLRVYRGECRRLIVSMPPGHGKSQVISRFFPSWWLGNRPRDRIISVSMSQELTREWSGAARNDFAKFAGPVWGVTASARASATKWRVYDAHSFEETGGSLFGVGIEGAVTGRRANVLIIDDVIRDIEQASNEAMRKAHYEWVRSVAIPRLLPGGAVIIVMTRWHEDDLIGKLLADQALKPGKYPWEVINLPAVCEDPGDPVGRSPGDALWPEMFPRGELDALRDEVGPYVWQSLYQGGPTPIGGGAFKRGWWKFYDRKGDTIVECDGGRTHDVRMLRRYSTWDLAVSKKESADYTVGGAWGAGRDRLFLLDVLRDRLEGPELLPTIRSFLAEHGLRSAFVEAMAFQKAIVQQAALERLPVRELKADGDKWARSLPAQAAAANGTIFLPRDAPWVAKFVAEHSEFPNGKNDDQVDMTSYGVQVYNRMGAIASQVKRRTHSKADRVPGEERGSWRIGR